MDDEGIAMEAYEPIDLSACCTGPADAAADTPAPLGSKLYRGLPFRLGDQERRLHVVVDAETGPVTIPVRRLGRRLLFAHRIAGHLSDYDPVASTGAEIARYRVRLADGQELEAPLRGRFEVMLLPEWPGDYDIPFTAVPSSTPTLPHRHLGRWEALGMRQGEFCLQMPPDYVLWAWDNPAPDTEIRDLTVLPGAGALLVGGITVCRLEEYPLLRAAAVPVRATLPDPVAVGADVRISIDRGESTFAHPVDESGQEALEPPAFGAPPSQESRSWYASITGLPSATVSVSVDDVPVGSVAWEQVQDGPVDAQGGFRLEVVEDGREWVHVTVLDEESGQPVPCRIRLRSAYGVPYPPHGHHGEVGSRLNTWHIDVGGDVRLGDATFAYIDGTCQGWLPRGSVVVEAARGFEYEPLAQEVQVRPGQRELTVQLKRWVSMADAGWYSGDSHVHFLSPQGALTEQRGEDLNVVNLLQSQWGSLFTNTEDFTGREHSSPSGPYVTYVSQENRHHLLGHLLLWGLSNPVMPWCSDGPPEAEIGSALEATVSDWADRCHAQGGTVIVPHLPRPNGEVAALVATGRADGVEMINNRADAHAEYYRFLNAGYRLPLVGGTDKMSADVPVGLYRTYARLGEREFGYQAWCEAVRRGRTFLSGGPMMELTVDGHDIGETVVLKGPGNVMVEARARSVFPMGTLQLVVDGDVVAQVEDRAGTRELSLVESVRLDGDSWIAARCGGPGYFDAGQHTDVWRRGVFAHTSPVYVACGGDWTKRDRTSLGYMQQLVTGGLEYVRQTSVQHKAGTGHHHGEADHLPYLERPFRQALEELSERLKALG